MHPDDALQVMDLGMQAFATDEGWQGSIIVRMHRGDGSYGPYEITAVNHFEHPVIGGMVVRTREVPTDAVDDFPGLEPRLAVTTLAELLPIGVLLLDGTGHVVYANETACGMLDREQVDLKHGGFAALVNPEDLAIVNDILGRLTAAPGIEECIVRFADARIERAECRFCSDGGADDVTSIAVTIEDVTQRWATQRALEKRANHDALTGLRNRASLYDVLQARLDRHEPTMVAFLDLDGFKTVNDRWGHERGDEVLVDVAHALLAGVDPSAEIGRIGGDEFVVVTGDLAADGGDPASWAAHLAALVEDAVRVDDAPITCSVGIGQARPGDTLRDLIHRADQAMYEAKAHRP